jgi:hypothetical protein
VACYDRTVEFGSKSPMKAGAMSRFEVNASGKPRSRCVIFGLAAAGLPHNQLTAAKIILESVTSHLLWNSSRIVVTYQYTLLVSHIMASAGCEVCESDSFKYRCPSCKIRR